MIIAHLEINNLRNLSHAQLEPEEKFNIIYGANGAGKTSLLEALYYLGMGRSFRSHLSRHIISYDSQQLVIFARIQSPETTIYPVGIECSRDGTKRIRISEQDVQQRAELAKLLPIRMLNADGYRFLELGPKYRRQFLDWGLFHVKQDFLSCWQRVQRTLKQRNAALRQGIHMRDQLQLWNEELSEASIILHQYRKDYIADLQPIIQQLLHTLFDEQHKVSIEYYPGWDTNKNLQELLAAHIDRDLKLGYSSLGPQRADLRCKINSHLAQDVLSRGQQKILICALRLAQGMYLQQQVQRNCIYLIDDLPSELDPAKRQLVIDILRQLDGQVFITGIEREDLTALLNPSDKAKLFHVKHGCISSEL